MAVAAEDGGIGAAAGEGRGSGGDVEPFLACLQALHFLCQKHEGNTARLVAVGGVELAMKGKCVRAGWGKGEPRREAVHAVPCGARLGGGLGLLGGGGPHGSRGGSGGQAGCMGKVGTCRRAVELSRSRRQT